MHDLDRNMFETPPLLGEEFEQADESELGDGELGEPTAGTAELEQLLDQESGEISEPQEVALASELLEATTDAEVDAAVRRLVRCVAPASQGPVARALPALRAAVGAVARKVLPAAGGCGCRPAAGRPGAGRPAAGPRAGAELLGLELEGLSHEDAEFELARAVVRLADTACRTAATAPRGTPAQVVAARALTAAARQHAPGLLRPAGVAGAPSRAAAAARPTPPRSADGAATGGRTGAGGRWIRSGRNIVILDA